MMEKEEELRNGAMGIAEVKFEEVLGGKLLTSFGAVWGEVIINR